MNFRPNKKKPLLNMSIGLKRVKDEEKLELAKSLTILIESGIPINEGIGIIIKQTKPGAYRNFLIDARQKIEMGNSLYQIFQKSGMFDQIFINFIKAGENSGTLTQNLKFLSEWLEKSIILKKEIRSATLYPKIILTFGLILGLGLSIFILPQVADVLRGLNVELPITTRILLQVAAFMREYGIFLVIGIIIFIFLFKLSSRIKPAKKIIDFLFIKAPVIGPIFRDYQLTLISQLAATLFKSGIPINHILEIISDAMPNYYYQKSIFEAKRRMEKGTNFSEIIGGFPYLYPPIFISVISIGEKTGTFEGSFSYLSDFFLSKVLRKTKLLPMIIEPVLLIIVGIFVAFIASAIILPIYEITRGIY